MYVCMYVSMYVCTYVTVKCCQNQGTYNKLPIRCTSPHPCQHQWETHRNNWHSYKYLGTTINDKPRWDDNTMNLYKKGQQRLYFLRKLNALNIDRHILFVFHDSFVKSVMTFGLVCLYIMPTIKTQRALKSFIPSPIK